MNSGYEHAGEPKADPAVSPVAESWERMSQAAEKLGRAADKLASLASTKESPIQKAKPQGEGESKADPAARIFQAMFDRFLGNKFERALGSTAGTEARQQASNAFGRVVRRLTTRKTAKQKTGKVTTLSQKSPPLSNKAAEALNPKKEVTASGRTTAAISEAGTAGRAAGAAGEAGVAAEVGGLAAAAGPLAIVAAAAIGLGIALKKFYDSVVDGAKEQQKVNFELAKSSAAMALVEAHSDVAKLLRDREVGDRTAGSASMLASANRDHDQITKEFEVLGSNVKNAAYAVGLEVVNKLIEPLGEIASQLNQILEEIGLASHETGGDFHAAVNDMEQAAKRKVLEWQERFAKDQRKRR